MNLESLFSVYDVKIRVTLKQSNTEPSSARYEILATKPNVHGFIVNQYYEKHMYLAQSLFSAKIEL